jgi:leucyl aminopeptidase
MGGAITAALFLARFVEDTKSYAHLDIYAWNDDGRPGRPRGGEATGLRALYTMIERRFAGAGAAA